MDEKTLDRNLDLRTRVANALADHPETNESVIEVINESGVITLSGEVASQEARQAAETIASEQPGVISVVNSLKVK